MPLTELQRKQLSTQINTLPMKTIIPYFENNEITLEEVPHISPERKEVVIKTLNSRPDPFEQRDWAAIEPRLIEVKQTNTDTYVNRKSTSDLDSIVGMLNVYISKWETKLPAGNHVEEAKLQLKNFEETIRIVRNKIEEEDWATVNKGSKDDLKAYIAKYPQSVHILEIDDIIWNMVVAKNYNVSIYNIQEYMTMFPNGNHYAEARGLYDAIGEWEKIKNSSDIFEINNYVRNNQGSPFELQARSLLMSLKDRELNSMRTRPNDYIKDRLIRIIKEGVFSENELINERVTTPNIIQIITSDTLHIDLPDVKKVIDDTKAECKDGYTDVYFFGVPSTGKTCALMGLASTGALQINLASAGGDYAMALKQYTDFGITVPRTPGTFVTTIEASMTARIDGINAEHKINLVEMSGEEFAFGIANNSDHKFTFEDMGTGATALLSNNNRKVFFLIIDPTTNIVRINREVIAGKDQYGNIITDLEYCAVNQQLLIHKMVNILQDPRNADIMKKVDSLHIIVTKADMLGAPHERDERAYDIFQQKYAGSILDPLIDLCKEYNINSNTGFCPKLYTFSLGTFYAGGLFEYDQTDSDRLVIAIKNSTNIIKKKSWLDRFKDALN